MHEKNVFFIVFIVLFAFLAGCSFSDPSDVPIDPKVEAVSKYYMHADNLLRTRHMEDHCLEAIAEYDRVLATRTPERYPWSQKGYCYFLLERYQDSVNSYKQAISLDPSYSDDWSMMGSSLSSLQQPAEALDALDQAIALDPKNEYAWMMKGDVLIKLERYREAADACDRALYLDPDDETAQSNKEMALRKLQISK